MGWLINDWNAHYFSAAERMLDELEKKYDCSRYQLIEKLRSEIILTKDDFPKLAHKEPMKFAKSAHMVICAQMQLAGFYKFDVPWIADHLCHEKHKKIMLEYHPEYMNVADVAEYRGITKNAVIASVVPGLNHRLRKWMNTFEDFDLELFLTEHFKEVLHFNTKEATVIMLLKKRTGRFSQKFIDNHRAELRELLYKFSGYRECMVKTMFENELLSPDDVNELNHNRNVKDLSEYKIFFHYGSIKCCLEKTHSGGVYPREVIYIK